VLLSLSFIFFCTIAHHSRFLLLFVVEDRVVRVLFLLLLSPSIIFLISLQKPRGKRKKKITVSSFSFLSLHFYAFFFNPLFSTCFSFVSNTTKKNIAKFAPKFLLAKKEQKRLIIFVE
jgi:hypothetical protein